MKMGANQSDQRHSETTGTSQSITIVNPNPQASPINENPIILNRVPPILSIGGLAIDPTRHKEQHQIAHQNWLAIVTTLDQFVSSRSDLISRRQASLQEKVSAVDEYVQRFTDSYINDKHKALARMKDDFRNIDDIKSQLDRCSIESNLCVDMLNKLNFLLPADQKLEPLKSQDPELPEGDTSQSCD